MFRDLFASLESSIPGFRFICVVARDGIEVGSHQSGDFPHEVMSAELNGVLRNLERMGEEYDLDGIDQVLIRTGNQSIFVQNLSSELFVLVGMDPNAPTGKTRYEILRNAHRFLEMLG